MKNKNGMIQLILLLVWVSFSIISFPLHDSKGSGSEDEFLYEFRINTIKYSGSYVGETEEGKPSGQGTFTAVEPYYFVYEGEFEAGTFHGEGIITYEDGDCLIGSFDNGVPDGKCKLVHSNGTYDVIRYQKGTPWGPLFSYSSDEEITGKDYFFDGIRVSKWIENSKNISYRNLFLNEDEYYGQALKLDCTVLNVYDNLEACYFKVKDKDNNIYWGAYDNTIQIRFGQAVMPNLKVGDELELYAFFMGIMPYSCPNDEENSGYSYPKLAPIIGTTSDFDLDYGNLSYDYDKVLRFPFHYYLVYTNITGTVESVIYSDSQHDLKVVDDEGNVYYCILEDLLKAKEETELPLPGDRVKYRGRFMGLHKESHTDSLDEDLQIFVAMKATSLKIIDK